MNKKCQMCGGQNCYFVKDAYGSYLCHLCYSSRHSKSRDWDHVHADALNDFANGMVAGRDDIIDADNLIDEWKAARDVLKANMAEAKEIAEAAEEVLESAGSYSTTWVF